MIRTPVVSSHITSIGHDPATSTLEVEFTNGTVYQYQDVPAALHRQLLAARSPGQAFHRLIRGGGFAFEQVFE